MIINTEKSQDLQIICVILVWSLIILFYHQLTSQTLTSFKMTSCHCFFSFSYQFIRVGGLKWHTMKYTYLLDGLPVLQWSIHSSSPTILWNLSSKPVKTKIKNPLPTYTGWKRMSADLADFYFKYSLWTFEFWICSCYSVFCKMAMTSWGLEPMKGNAKWTNKFCSNLCCHSGINYFKEGALQHAPFILLSSVFAKRVNILQ